MTYRIEGPFDSNYSLAIVNREIAKCLDKIFPGQVHLHSTDGLGDYEPNSNFLKENTKINELWKRKLKSQIILRNLYPPRVKDMTGELNIMLNYAWEESLFPLEYVEDFNKYLDFIAVTSNFVKKALIDSGVEKPIYVVGNGSDHILNSTIKEFYIPDAEFYFLHISSCFPRKGVDLLLEAYVKTFKLKDETLLIIKTFANPHNDLLEKIKYWQSIIHDCPLIYVIQDELTFDEMGFLYKKSDVLVMPSRGEGFGIPLAEAMLLGLPVITTAYGGQSDFCNSETAWLIDYSFAKAQAHLSQENSLWIEPDLAHLMSLMRTFFEQKKNNRFEEYINSRVEKARVNILSNWTWDLVTGRLLKCIDNHKNLTQNITKNQIAWITTWNSHCGIANYSRFLLKYIDFPVKILANIDDQAASIDDANVVRCWKISAEKSESLSGLLNVILTEKFNVVVIQFNFVFFDLNQLKVFLKVLQAHKVAIYVFFHATNDVRDNDGRLLTSIRYLGDSLKECKRLIVHTLDDVNRLKRWGYVENVTMIPHGVLYEPSYWNKESKAMSQKLVLGSYGFLLPNKGISVLIRSFSILLDLFENLDFDLHLNLFNSLYPNSVSIEEEINCRHLIEELNLSSKVSFYTHYQSDDEALDNLSKCDLIVFPYQYSGESTSGAVRIALASGVPVVCTPLDIFKDVRDIVHCLPGITSELIAKGIFEFIHNVELRSSILARQVDWVKANRWKYVAQRFNAIIKQTSCEVTKTNN